MLRLSGELWMKCMNNPASVSLLSGSSIYKLLCKEPSLGDSDSSIFKNDVVFKYAAGLLFFHSRKKDLVIQEIYAKLILYNFCELITGAIVVEKRIGSIVIG